MRLLAVLILVAVLAFAVSTGAGAATQKTLVLSRAGGEVAALTVSGSRAVALVDAGQDGPFGAVRSDGTRVERLGTVGGGEFPMLAAADDGRVVAAWDDPISGGVRYSAHAVLTGSTHQVAVGTGPGRLAVSADGSIVLAHPDLAGDVAVTTFPDVARPRAGKRSDPDPAPGTVALTSDAPARRHFTAGLALRKEGPLVLDLVQRRKQSELQVVGEGAPRGPVASVGRLRQIQGALAVSGDRIAVAYVSSGRPVLATAVPGGTWRRRVLPGRGVTGAPAVAFSKGRIAVAWSQRGEIYSATVGAKAAVRRLTRSADEDGAPLLAAGPTGRLFAAWTSVRGRHEVPLLRPLG